MEVARNCPDEDRVDWLEEPEGDGDEACPPRFTEPDWGVPDDDDD